MIIIIKSIFNFSRLTNLYTTMLPQEVELITSVSHAKLEKNQLVINDGISVKEWKELGLHLSRLQGNIQFWIGDWIRFGSKKGYYTTGDVYDEAEEITGLERGTIQTYKWVAERTSSTRVEDLSFKHHRVVAKLGESEQIYFLNKALQEKLSCAELALQIMYENTPGVPVRDIRYDNNSPFPIRLGDLHLKLQEEAFEMKTTIHMRALDIIREYFERKEHLKLNGI